MAKKARRTTLRSSAGKKLYAVRTADGQFKDIQTYERAHRADLAKTSKAEAPVAGKKTAKKAGKKAKAGKVGKKVTKKAGKKAKAAKKAKK